jgi:hypothetical protein
VAPSSSNPTSSPTATKPPANPTNAPTDAPTPKENSSNVSLLYISIGAGSIVPICLGIALFMHFRNRRQGTDTVVQGEIAAAKADKDHKKARNKAWKAGGTDAERSLSVFEVTSPHLKVDVDAEEGTRVLHLVWFSAFPNARVLFSQEYLDRHSDVWWSPFTFNGA